MVVNHCIVLLFQIGQIHRQLLKLGTNCHLDTSTLQSKRVGDTAMAADTSLLHKAIPGRTAKIRLETFLMTRLNISQKGKQSSQPLTASVAAAQSEEEEEYTAVFG